MRCERCGNEDDTYFYNDRGTWYCRKCVNFGRLNVGESISRKEYSCRKHRCNYHLKYPLTKEQKRCSKEIDGYLKNKQDVLVFAACGSGKTEIVMDSIKKYLNAGKKVGFAISRRQVVLEICERMKEAFSTLNVVAVCEGFTDVVDGDLIICTMHQLYRYHKTFDLLIMDEVDAFPYKHNEMLEHIAMNACVANVIYLTATPDEIMLSKVARDEIKMVELFIRPHEHPLVLPDIICTYPLFQYYYLYTFLSKHREKNIPVLVFVPTILLANKLSFVFRLFFKCASFTSKTIDKELVIKKFKDKEYQVLFTTTILERGITIKGIHIVVLQADHIVFDEASLIQIIGRVGRSIEKPDGEGLFLCTKKSLSIKRCHHAIKEMNASQDFINET
ncbi:MAG: helicase-related protein [Erysipelotrichaceae bacterium]